LIGIKNIEIGNTPYVVEKKEEFHLAALSFDYYI
jgi:hypothetical protein